METTEKTEESTSKEGCLRSVLKLAAWIVIPIVALSFAMSWLKDTSSVDEIGRSLIPFHNDYISFDDYYLTIELLTSNWIFRLLIFAVPSLMLLALINAISSSLIKSENGNTYFIRGLMALFMVIVIGLVWLVPLSKTTIDGEGKRLVRSQFEITHFETSTLPFERISEVWYEYKTKAVSRDNYTKYLYIKVKSTEGSVWLIGVCDVGSYAPVQGYTSSDYVLPVSDEEAAYGASIIRNLNQLLKK